MLYLDASNKDNVRLPGASFIKSDYQEQAL